MEKEYDISITVILEKSIIVKAKDEKDAERKIMNKLLKEPLDETEYNVDYQLQICES